MGLITLSRQYGSDGRTVGLKVAQLLGYHYVNKEIISRVANEANVPVSEVERFDEKPESAALRVLKKFLAPNYSGLGPELAEHDWWTATTLSGTLPATNQSMFLDEDVYVRLTREVIQKLSERDDLVILGRGALSFLKDREDTLHVRIVASEDHRIQTAMERDSLDEETARREVARIDEGRKTYLKRHYNLDWDQADQYHLVV
ncbi:cytidylate kinase-like family protein, partial [bacterium]|nr:cytidylate kinase-like family protein [bacterium]